MKISLAIALLALLAAPVMAQTTVIQPTQPSGGRDYSRGGYSASQNYNGNTVIQPTLPTGGRDYSRGGYITSQDHNGKTVVHPTLPTGGRDYSRGGYAVQ